MYLLPEYVVVISEKHEYVLLPEYEEFWLPGLIANIRSDYMIIEIKKGLATLKISFANEKQLIKILNSFVNIAGELNRNNKGK
jgi:hypothetical protein